MSYLVGDIEKTKVTDFKTALSPQEVVSYLSSRERLKKTTHLYHYTKLSSMIGVIKSGYWVMRSSKYMSGRYVVGHNGQNVKNSSNSARETF